MKHIAILRQPFFNMVLSGEKTIESRWSMNKTAPYNRVNVGDVIYLKETGKAVTAKAVAARVEQFKLTPTIVEEIRIKYGREIGTDKFQDWQGTLNKKYCTLIWLEQLERIEPMPVKKSFGAGWLVFNDWKIKKSLSIK